MKKLKMVMNILPFFRPINSYLNYVHQLGGFCLRFCKYNFCRLIFFLEFLKELKSWVRYFEIVTLFPKIEKLSLQKLSCKSSTKCSLKHSVSFHDYDNSERTSKEEALILIFYLAVPHVNVSLWIRNSKRIKFVTHISDDN